ncbi:MAG: DUF4870 domain-containing protein [Phycisphaerae bacterium]|nr:DUF4870 domain-containing protein [Phycisphaerae bacterium]
MMDNEQYSVEPDDNGAAGDKSIHANGASSEPIDTDKPVSADNRKWALFCHLIALPAMFVPFGNFAGPMFIWQLKREKSDYIDQQGRKAVNFQLTMLLIAGCLYTIGVLGLLFGEGDCMSFCMSAVLLLAVFDAIAVILATMEVHKGKDYAYLFSIEFFKHKSD